jgi:hypothetical protein
MPANFYILFLLLLLSSNALTSSYDSVLVIPPEAPREASDVIDLSFPGFAFEQASFYDYSIDADGEPNTFSQNLINSVLSRTGGTPILRVGGTSGDKGHCNASQLFPVSRPATEGGPAFRPPYLSLGPSYFEAFKNFPGAKYIFMVPLAHRNLNNSLEWAREGLGVIGDRLQALDIGNEPDLYRWFDLPTYVKHFTRFQNALVAEFPKQLGQRPIFQALDTAWGGASTLAVSAAIEAGINSTGAISQIAYHLYQANTIPGAGLDLLQGQVANHTAIVEVMSVFEPHIKYLREHAPGVPFILDENGNSLGRRELLQRNVFATTLWNVDYQLHGMAMGVSRVNNQQIVFPGFQMWEPVDSKFGPRCVRPNFYSQPFVADFIGRSGKTRVLELEVTGTDLLSAYIAFDDEVPARIALVNLELWTPDNGTRPSADITLTGLYDRNYNALIHRLASPEGAYGISFITWRGLQWTSKSNGLEVRVGTGSQRLHVYNGSVTVTVEATSAVIVDLDSGGIPWVDHEL